MEKTAPNAETTAGEVTCDLSGCDNVARWAYSETLPGGVFESAWKLCDLHVKQDPRGVDAVPMQPMAPSSPSCTVPPPGWRCTREAGHEGPCAAIPTTPRAPAPVPGDLPPVTPILQLRRIRGENAEEIVFWGGCGKYDFFVKHEYPDAPCWEGIITCDREPLEFVEAETFGDVETKLAELVVELVPEFVHEEEISRTSETPSPTGLLNEVVSRAGGLVRLVGLGLVVQLRKRLERWEHALSTL